MFVGWLQSHVLLCSPCIHEAWPHEWERHSGTNSAERPFSHSVSPLSILARNSATTLLSSWWQDHGCRMWLLKDPIYLGRTCSFLLFRESQDTYGVREGSYQYDIRRRVFLHFSKFHQFYVQFITVDKWYGIGILHSSADCSPGRIWHRRKYGI